MSYLVLARKYRPQTFEDVVAQEHVTTTLKNAVATGRVHHALCLSGPRGTGKTTVARVFAKAMNCKNGPTPTPCNVCPSCKEITRGNSVDVFEIDGASNNGVEQIRELRENVKYSPARSAYKIYIIDEVHMLTTQAFNALLKTLEEPPPHVLFVMATTEFHKIPVTIRSRCLRFDFRRITPADLVGRMEHVCQAEGIDIKREVLDIVARESDGCMRDALSLLDQVAAHAAGPDGERRVLDILGVVGKERLFTLAGALLAGDAAGCLQVIDALHQTGQDMRKLTADLVAHFRDMLVVKRVEEPGAILDLPASHIARLREAASQASASHIGQVLGVLHREEVGVRLSGMPRLALEVACMEICGTPPALDIGELIGKLDRLQEAVMSRAAAPAPEARASGPKASWQTPVPAAPPARTAAPLERAAAPYSRPAPARTEPEPSASAGQENPVTCFKRLMGSRHPYLALALERSSLSAENTVLSIGYGNDGLESSILINEENRANIVAVWRDCAGEDAQARFVSEKPEAAPEAPPPEPRQTKRDPAQELMNHPLVADAIEIFKGRVLTIKPL
jgi:DNA polymerase-3 subunit gamma/tau